MVADYPPMRPWDVNAGPRIETPVPPPIDLRGAWWWLWTPTALLALMFVTFGVTGAGPIHVDANYLTVPAVVWASGGELSNPLVRSVQAFDAQGPGRFIYHGPGFQIALRAFLKPPTGPQALLIIHVLNVATIVLFGWFLYRLLRRYLTSVGPAVWIGTVAALSSSSAVLLAAVGRPESLTTPLLLAGAHLLLPTSSRTVSAGSRTVLVAVVLGLVLVTHPLTGVQASLGLAVWFGVRERTPVALRSLALLGIVAGAVALGVLAIAYPIPITSWFSGMLDMSVLVVGMVDTRISRFFFLAPNHPLFGLTLVTGIVIGGRWLWSRRHLIGSPSLVAIPLILFVSLVTKFSLLTAFRVYDQYPGFPLVLAGLLLAAARASVTSVRIAIVAMMIPAGIGTVRHAFLFPYYQTRGMSLAEARDAFREVLAAEQGPIGVTMTGWLLTEDYDRLRVNFALDNLDERTGQPLDVIVVEQSHYPERTSVPGYQLVHSDRRSGIPTLFGIPLAHSMPGHQFDVYHRSRSNLAVATGVR